MGAVYSPQAAEVFDIGRCGRAGLAALLESSGRRQDAIIVGVLWRNSEVAHSLADRLVIPYRRGNSSLDLRGSGIRGSEGGTKEMSLASAYATRDVDDLLFNRDALDQLHPDGDLHIVGDTYKAITLHLTGLVAVSTRDESELSDDQLAVIAAARPGRIINHADSEYPREGHTPSMARQLVMPKAERLATIAPILIVEPPREPGTMKSDSMLCYATTDPA